MERMILLTGKGGVGKTSLAAAHAVASAGSGKRTLLASMDAAHNLSDLFDCPPAPEPTEVAPNLEITEVDAGRVAEEEFTDITTALSTLISRGDDDQVLDLPGFDPLFFLLRVHQLAHTGDYDRIILDLAPTGETLSLLQFPELLTWWMERIFPVQKLAVRVLRPVAKGVWRIELPNAAAMNDIERLFQRLQEIQALLKDSSITSVRLVTLPERMVIEETRRSYLYLNLFGYSVDHVFVSGLYPTGEVGAFFSTWVEHQRQHLAEIRSSFAHLPITEVPRFRKDLVGQGAEDGGDVLDLTLALLGVGVHGEDAEDEVFVLQVRLRDKLLEALPVLRRVVCADGDVDFAFVQFAFQVARRVGFASLGQRFVERESAVG